MTCPTCRGLRYGVELVAPMTFRRVRCSDCDETGAPKSVDGERRDDGVALAVRRMCHAVPQRECAAAWRELVAAVERVEGDGRRTWSATEDCSKMPGPGRDNG